MSDVLTLIRLQAGPVATQRHTAPWLHRYREPHPHFHVIERGGGWLTVGRSTRVRVQTGDVLILSSPIAHTLSSDPPPSAREGARSTVRAPRRGADMHTDVYTELLTGQFSFRGVLAPRLLASLPPVIHVSPGHGRALAWLKLNTAFLIDETRNPRPGSAIMVARLVELLFIQSLREWGATNPRRLGWLGGLADPAIGRALAVIHDRPADAWTVRALARRAGVSRSAFARRFGEVTGTTPLRYLAGWRLNLAADHLRTSSATLEEVAAVVGYGSGIALTRAFKKQFGVAPGAFRRARTPLA